MNICPKCGVNEVASPKDPYCKECKKEYNRKRMLKKSIEKYKDADPSTFVVCEICGFHASNLNIHLRNVHGITTEEYRQKYKKPAQCENYLNYCSEKMKGDKNPNYNNHSGKLSPFSDEFINKTETSKKDAIEKMKRTKEENDSHTTRLSYYTTRGMSDEEAEKALKERQTTFNKDKCIEKYGEKEGLEVWERRQENWLISYLDRPQEELEIIQIKKNPSFGYMMDYFKIDEKTLLQRLKKIDKDDFKRYSDNVTNLTNKVYRKHKHKLDPVGKRGNDYGYDLDHKFSRLIGYIEGISEEVLCCLGNLELMKSAENDSKNCKCSITKEELFSLYENEMKGN